MPVAAVSRPVAVWLRRSSFALAVGLLAGCLGDGLDSSTRQNLAMMQTGQSLQQQSDQQALAAIGGMTADHDLTVAALTGLWQDRPELLAAALARGADPNRPIPSDILLYYPTTLEGDTTAPIQAAVMLDPASVTGAPTLALRSLARSGAALDALIAAGATFDAQALNDALYVAVAFGRDPALMDRLQAMGGRLDAPLRPRATPVQFAAALYADPDILARALDQGLDPTLRLSLPGHVGHSEQFQGVRVYQYYDDLTALHYLAAGGLSAEDRRRQVANARLLIAAGADVNAPATYAHSIGSDRRMTGWTPLHAAYAGLQGYGGNPELVALLESSGADPDARTSTGETPRQVAGQTARINAEVAALATARPAASASRSGGSRPSGSRSSGSGRSDADMFGQMIAAAGMMAVTASAMGSGMDSSTAMMVGGAGLLDILSDGQAGATSAVTQQARQAQQARAAQSQTRPAQQTSAPVTASAGATSAAASAAAAGLQHETYTVRCPSGVSNSIPLSFRTQQCRSAMINLATVYSCNDFERFEAAHATCQASCGSPNCLQE